jgi:hypothetical protein
MFGLNVHCGKDPPTLKKQKPGFDIPNARLYRFLSIFFPPQTEAVKL